MAGRRNSMLKYMPAECIYCLVMIFPGITTNQIARHFKINPALITGRLNTLESRGLLLSEDEHGGLYHFDVYTSKAGICQP